MKEVNTSIESMRRQNPQMDFSEMDEINIQMLVNNDGLTSGHQEIQT